MCTADAGVTSGFPTQAQFDTGNFLCLFTITRFG